MTVLAVAPGQTRVTTLRAAIQRSRDRGVAMQGLSAALSRSDMAARHVTLGQTRVTEATRTFDRCFA